MPRISDPTQVDNPELRELAIQAAWVAKLEDAIAFLEDLMVDEDHAEDDAPPEANIQPWDEEPIAVALSVVQANFEEVDRNLEDRLTEWLAKDPEHWPIFRLVVLDPWQEQPGHWRDDVPDWALSLGSNATIAHFQQDSFGRRQVIDLDDSP